MLVLEAVSKRRIWGTNRLHEYSGDKAIDKVGSVYSASAIKEISNSIDSDEFTEKDFYSAVTNHPEKFGLAPGQEFPIIISMTGADADLSIQAHPTDDYAQQNEGKHTGKSESWYFIDAPSNQWIYAGAKLDNKDEITAKIKEGLVDEVVDTIEVNEGDLIFIPSGTLHALTKGSLVYEIQQSTDITYRFYDYDRLDVDGQKRELHLEKAVETLELDQNVKKDSFERNVAKKEKPYTIIRKELAVNYTNTHEIAQIITVIGQVLEVNQEKINKGSSFVVFPGETIKVRKSTEVIIATANLY